jgi:site-specific DNA recombinase
MKQVVAYIRVSTIDQTGEDRYGLESQKSDIEQYCQQNGYSITRWYTDAVGGLEEERPELDKLLFEDEEELNPVRAVVVAKSDRLARDIYLYRKLDARKVVLPWQAHWLHR